MGHGYSQSTRSPRGALPHETQHVLLPSYSTHGTSLPPSPSPPPPPPLPPAGGGATCPPSRALRGGASLPESRALCGGRGAAAGSGAVASATVGSRPVVPAAGAAGGLGGVDGPPPAAEALAAGAGAGGERDETPKELMRGACPAPAAGGGLPPAAAAAATGAAAAGAGAGAGAGAAGAPPGSGERRSAHDAGGCSTGAAEGRPLRRPKAGVAAPAEASEPPAPTPAAGLPQTSNSMESWPT